MRSTSSGRWSGAPRSLLPGPIDTKKNPRPDASIGASATNTSTLSRPSSAQKLRPGSRLNVMDSSSSGRPTTPTNIGRPTTPTNIGRPTTPTNIGRPTTPTAIRPTTPTSTSRSLSASRTRPAVHQLFTVASPTLQGPVPIDQRSKFTVSRSVTPGKDAMSPNVGTPTRSRIPTKASNSTGGASKEVKVGPYGFMLRELKREKNMFVKDDTKERDLKTLMNQLQLFKLQLKKKLESDRVQEEKLLLQSWQLVYDAEEEAFGLRSKEKIALEINKIHAQLVDMDNRVDQVNNFIAPVFEKLNTYVNLRMHEIEEEKSSGQVRSITAKASINREYSTAFLKLDKSIRVLERMLEKRDRLTGPVKTPEAKRSSSFTFEMPVLTPVTEDKKIKKTISSNTFEVPALVHVENFVDDTVNMPGTIKESSKPQRRPSKDNMLGSATKAGLKPAAGSVGSPSAPAAAAPAVPVFSTPVRSSEESSGHTLTPKSSSENLKKGFMRPTQSTAHHVEETREAHHQTLTPKSSMENVKKDVSPKTSKEATRTCNDNLGKKELSPKHSMENVKKGLTPKPSMENLTVKKDAVGGVSPKTNNAAGGDNNKSFRRINSNGSMTGLQRPSSANSLLKKNSNPTLTGKKSSGGATPVTPNNKANLELGDIQMVDDDVNVDDDEEMIRNIPAVVMPTQKEAAASATKERPRSANSISYARATPDPAPSVPDGRHSINLSEISNLKGLSSGGGFDDFASKLASLESGFYQIPEFKPKTKRSKSIDRSTTPSSVDGASTPSILKNQEKTSSLSNGAAISDLTSSAEAPAAASEESASVSAPISAAASTRSPAKSAVAAALSVDSTADLIPLNKEAQPQPSPRKNSAPAPVTAEPMATASVPAPSEKMDLAAKIAALESRTAAAALIVAAAPTAAAPLKEDEPAPAAPQSSVQKSFADFMAKNRNSANLTAEQPSVSVAVEKPAVVAPLEVAAAPSEPVAPAAAPAPVSSVKQSYADFLAKNKSNNSTSSLTIETGEAPTAPVVAPAAVEVKPAVVAAPVAVAPATAPVASAPAVPSGNAYSNFMKKFKSEKASPVTVQETPKVEEPVSIVTGPAATTADVVSPELSPMSPNPSLGTYSVDSSAPTPPRNAYANFLSKNKPASSLSISNSNNTSSYAVAVEPVVPAAAPVVETAAPLSISTTATPVATTTTEIPTPSRNAYAEFMAKKNSTAAPVSTTSSTADTSGSSFLDSLPPPAARPPAAPSLPPAVPTTAAAPPPTAAPAAKSAYGAFLSKNKSNSTSFYSKNDAPAVASSSAYIDVPATNITSSVVVDDEPPPSVYTAHRLSLKRHEQVPDVVREELVIKSPSSDKLSSMGGSENQPVAPAPQPSKNAYSDFLKKRPSITAPANTSASHLDENSTESTSAPSPVGSGVSAKSPAAPVAASPVPAVATPAPATAAAPTSAYAAFLKKNSSTMAPAPQVSYTAVAATEEPVVDIAALRASAEATSSQPSAAAEPTKPAATSSLSIEVSEKPPRPMSTRTAYADFLSKKKSTMTSDSSAVDDEAAGGSAVSSSASPASVSSTASTPLVSAAVGDAPAAAPAPSSSTKMSYQDFIKKKPDPATPKKPSVDYGATAATYEDNTAPTAEGVAVLKPGEFTAYGEILAKFKKTESEDFKPNSPSSKSNKSSPKSDAAAPSSAAAAAPPSEPLPPPQHQEQYQEQSVLKSDSNENSNSTPPILQTVSQDYYGSKNITPDKNIPPFSPTTPGVGMTDDFEPREGIENYDSFDEHDQQFNKPIDWDGKGSASATAQQGRDKSHSIDSSSKVQGLPPLQPSGSKPKGLARFMSFTMSSPSPKKPPSESGSVDGQLRSPSQDSSQGSVDENGEPKKKKRNPIHFLQKNVFGRQSSSKI